MALAHAPEESVKSKFSKDMLRDTPYLLRSGELSIKVIAYRDNGPENVAIGEITLPSGFDSKAHGHVSAEWIYVNSGKLKQTVNGVVEELSAGGLSIAPPNSTLVHQVTSKEPAKLLIFWLPANEVDRLADGGFRYEAITTQH
jgi:quercetin dioxygenase-like cupin family protein